jgi:hypothetical protein
MLMEIGSLLLSTAVMFVFGFVALFLIYYFTTPIYTLYGDKKSRLYYSLINSAYFSLILAILFSLLPAISESSGLVLALAVGIVVILIGTVLQVYFISSLAKRGIIKMRQKPRRKKN